MENTTPNKRPKRKQAMIEPKHGLECFLKSKLTKKQKRDIFEIEDLEQLFIYLISTYNCYAITHSKEHLSMITNPDALFMTTEEKQQFIAELKDYIRDVIGIKKEDVYGTTYDNRTNRKDIQNRG